MIIDPFNYFYSLPKTLFQKKKKFSQKPQPHTRDADRTTSSHQRRARLSSLRPVLHLRHEADRPCVDFDLDLRILVLTLGKLSVF